jgi:5-methyltetrahydropteroyltriglutamate--homocysteine methyltransferase
MPRGHKVVVLGLVTSIGRVGEQGRVEAADRRGGKYLPLEQLALSPQCGFASTEEGNVLTEEEQWAKLRLCVEVAREVWGGI